MMEVPAQLVLCCLDSRQQLLDTSIITHGQQRRTTISLLVGRAGAQNVCVVTPFKSSWPVYPSLSMLLSSHGGRSSGRNRCSSSVWKKLSTNANASGEAQTIEQLWEQYFANPMQWWDNRVDKSNPRSPDFKHKVTRKALWVDDWSNPPWVKAMLKSVTECKLQSHGCTEFMHQSQDILVKIEKLWEEYFATPSEWWDNRATKTNPRYPDFKHMHTREALWVGDLRNPPWVKQQLNAASQDTTNSDDQSPLDGCIENERKLRIQQRPISQTGEATAFLKKHLQQGITIDSYMYVEVLQMCFKQKDLVSAKQVHDCIRKSAMEQNVYVANNLLRVYIRCGRLQDARRVFDKLVKKSVFSWTIMIGGYAQHDHAEDAMEVFSQMRQEGAQPDEITYLSILKACASPVGLKWGKEVHDHIKHAGLESDVRVGTALLKMYANSGSIDDARLLFDKIVERDVITWNVMIGGLAQQGCGHEAFSLFLQMQRGGFVPDAITYVSILSACASPGALEWVKEVHSHALRAGLESDVRVGNALVHMYAKSGSIDDAQLVFDRMMERDVITWTVMIGGLAQYGCGYEAFSLFLQMQKGGFVPNAITFVSILSACAGAGALEWVKEVHSHALRAGLESDVRVGNALVHMYAKSGSIDDARLIFDRIVERNVVTWNTMIGGLAQHRCGHEALSLLLQMERGGFVPDEITYLSILNACASTRALEWVKEVHSHVLRAGLESDLRVGTALVNMYAKSGSIDDARLVFDRMVQRHVVTWNVMIGGLAQQGCGHEAFSLFLQMQSEGFVPNAITYVSILSACASTGALEWVKEVHSHALRAGLESDLRVGTALVNIYAKSGSIDDARLVFDRMMERDVVTWTVMIGGLAQHGCGHEALLLFGQMNAEGFRPDEVTFVATLSACSHVGLVDEGRHQFLAMTQDYGIKPTMEHYTCMVDLLGRAGHLEEAKLFILNMPLKPDGATWGALLGACRTYGNVELAEFAAKECLKLEPKNAAAYVLLSNIYAAAGQWDQVSSVRTVMQGRGIHKEPGRSWIEIDNEIHQFVVGDTSHPEAKEIYVELNILTKKMKAEGYIPDTRLVLHNIDEEDKELALCSHSEKLAIAYGLMHTAPRNPIRIYKNLRVCSDCHTATKVISKVTGRKIVARDANRFHHFKDGECSCGDYW